MTTRTIESSTLDAWRWCCCLSVFFFCITANAVVFNVENEQQMRRCLNSQATKSECLLTVYGR